jgi:hypothetical protein
VKGSLVSNIVKSSATMNVTLIILSYNPLAGQIWYSSYADEINGIVLQESEIKKEDQE